MNREILGRSIRALALRLDRRGAVALAVLAIAGEPENAGAAVCRQLKATCKRGTQCCSGVCRGKKRLRCKAHDTGGCKPDDGGCGIPFPCTTTLGLEGNCYTTTGGAGFCGATGDCQACTRDSDCQALFGPKSACIADCDYCPETGGSACVLAGIAPLPMDEPWPAIPSLSGR